MSERPGTTRTLHRVWWHVRFFACAFVLLDFEHPRVQRLVEEYLRGF